MEYQIQLDIFQGPLDLLLHLIEKDEIDIYNIPIASITDKYLDYIHTMQALNLETVGDFLVMAATLMQIKAKLLLPQLSDQDAVNEDEEDPRWELAQKLIEYKKIKEAALSLQALEGQQSKFYTRISGEFADKKIASEQNNGLKDLSIWDLLEAFKVIMESLDPKVPEAVPKQAVSIKQRMTEILDLMATDGRLFFKTVFSDVTTKIGLITCFLAVLELIRLHKIIVLQEVIFGEITLSLPEKVCNSV
jgi:segregation and condensation protein A